MIIFLGFFSSHSNRADFVCVGGVILGKNEWIKSDFVFLSRMTTSRTGTRTQRRMKVSGRKVNFVQLGTLFCFRVCRLSGFI